MISTQLDGTGVQSGKEGLGKSEFRHDEVQGEQVPK